MRTLVYYTINIAVLFCGLLTVNFIVGKTDVSDYEPYESASIKFDYGASFNIRKFAIKQNESRFLLAGDTPSELKLAFSFSSSKKLRLQIKPLYPNWICERKGRGKAYIKFQGNNIDKTERLTLNNKINFDLEVFRGDSIKVSLWNSYQKDCGRAEIKFTEKSYTKAYHYFFFLFWLFALLVLKHLRLSLFYASFGIVLNCLIVYANATISTVTYIYSVNASIQTIAITGLLIAIQNLVPNRVIRSLLSTALITTVFLLLVLFIGHFILFETPVSQDVIHALLQSNVNESLQFLESTIGWSKIILCVFLMIIAFAVSMVVSKRSTQSKFVTLMLGGATLLPVLASYPSQLDNSPMIHSILSARSKYFYELDTFKLLKESRSNVLDLQDASSDNRDQTLIVVIGESANKNHLSLYGYPRNTTLKSDMLHREDKLIRFDRVYANHIHTDGALTNALTSASQYTNDRWMSSPSLVGIAKKLGINTTWITNQQILGAWDNKVSVLAKEAENVVSKNKLVGIARDASHYDGVLINELEKALLKKNHSKLIFVHLQGSHASYCSRFPKESSFYKGKKATKREFGGLASYIQKTNNGVVNCYDNSISYTDELVNQIINLLRKQKEPTAMLYFSDHSEDVINNKAHNTALFTYEMTEIPMIFWASELWKQSFNSSWANLKRNSKRVFTNDHIFETLSGLLGINSAQINLSHDLSSKQYSEVKKPLTLLGRKLLSNSDNFHYWQQLNITEVVEKGQCSMLIPHRANSLGKIRSAIRSGLCGFEIDIFIENQQGKTILSVGHDRKTMTETTLESILEELRFDNVEKIWLDVKNVSDSNISDLNSRLRYLDEKFGLKTKVIVETSHYGKKVSTIKTAGYKVSYYLPTSTIIDVMKLTKLKQNEIAKVIEQRIIDMDASEISFDLRLYPFVKEYLEPRINSTIKGYHTWFPDGLTMSTKGLLEKLSLKQYYKDSMVKTILLPYQSKFNL